MTRALAEEKAALLETPPPRQKAAAVHRASAPRSATPQTVPSVRSSNATALAGFNFKESDLAIVSVAHAGWKASQADKENATAELLNRGYEINDGRVFLQMEHFEAMAPATKGAVMRAGIGLVEVSARTKLQNDETPSDYAAARELTFPEPTNKVQRTWRNFDAFTAQAIKDFAEETKNERGGVAARVEFFDAWASMGSESWRNPTGEVQGDRRKFWEKFRETFNHCAAYGPIGESPNDPPPPVSPNAMTAQQFLALPAAAIQALWKTMQQQWMGRNLRAELKRAYRDGSPAEKAALRSFFELSLTSFPEEQI